MYSRRQTRPKPRQSKSKRWPAPVAGWVANRALADPASIEGQGAAVLDNFFPRATTVSLRRGRQPYAQLGAADPTALFSYRNGTNKRFFAADATTIYDLTSIPVPFPGDPAGAADVLETGYSGGDWITTQFATTGGVYLIGVNGADDGFVFDGDAFYPYVAGGVIRLGFDAQTIVIPAGATITGGTSGATGQVWKTVNTAPTTGYLLLTNVTGTFQDNEALTGAPSGAATVNGAPGVAAPGVTFPGGVTTANMAYVWAYKNRLFFAEKDSMNAWYMTEVDAIGGNADVFPLSGIFAQGGSLLFASPWSLDSSGDAGLTEQCAFVSSLGEVAVFQGTSPNEADSWAKVGLYRIGTPLGKRAWIKGGGDLAIATTVGLVPLSKAITLEITALAVATVSYKIADAWADATVLRGASDWLCHVWADAKMAIVAPPPGTSVPELFVSNTETGAWARFTGWQVLCMEVFGGRLFFGSSAGKIYLANISGTDDGDTYSGAVLPLFDDFGAPGQLKIGTVGRARVRANARITGKLDLHADFERQLPPAPNADTAILASAWGAGEWGVSVWGDLFPNIVCQDWQSTGGSGYSLSACYQLTSGSAAPLDADIVDIELFFTVAEAVT